MRENPKLTKSKEIHWLPTTKYIVSMFRVGCVHGPCIYDDKGPNKGEVLRGYAQTYCCPTRGIVLGLLVMGMVGMKGVVGGSEGRRGDWGERS